MTDSSRYELIQRTNMLNRAAESWRPPLFLQSVGSWLSAKAALRRLLDLQAGSIWRDLKNILPRVRGTLVDVGCGAQPYRSLVPSVAKYIGIDSISSKEHFGYEIQGALYFAGDQWPIADATADFVLCAETLEHVPDPRKFLAEAFRCLVPGGIILITVPFAARWHFIPHDYWRFTPSGLACLLRDSGFVNTRVYARGNALTVACYKVMALLLRLVFPQRQALSVRLALQVLAVPFIPVLLILAILANCSLAGQGGDDCLGYTAISERKPR